MSCEEYGSYEEYLQIEEERENLQNQQFEIFDKMKEIRLQISSLEEEFDELENLNEDLKNRACELGVNLISF